MTAGLLLVTAVDLDLLLDRLAVRDLGGLENSLDLILALELCHEDGQLHIADARNDELLGLGIVAVGEGLVLFFQLDKAVGDLVFGALDLGVDSHLVHRLVVGHALDANGLARQAEGVAGLDGGKLREDADVAAADLGSLGVVLALREEHIAELFRIAGADVGDGEGVLHVAGDNLEVGVLAVLVSQRVENERHRAAVRVELELGLAALVVDLGHGLALEGVRRILDDVGHQVGGAEAGVGAAAENGGHAAVPDTGLDAGLKLFSGKRLFHEELLHEGLVSLRDLLVEFGHVFFNPVVGVCGQSDLLAVCVIGLLLNQVDQADSRFALHDGEGERNDGSAEHFAQGIENVEEVGVLLVELGDVEHGGKTGLGEILPALFGADTDAALGGQADETRVNHAQGLHDLTGKVKIARIVDHVELALVIFNGNDGRRNGILSLLLFVVKVRNSGAISTLAQTGDRLGGEQHTLAQSGFAVAAVAKQADVANVIGSIAHSKNYSFLQTGRKTARSVPRQFSFRRLLNSIIYESS